MELLEAAAGKSSCNRGKVHVLLAFVVVTVLTFLCFAPDLNNELLIWDDAIAIVNNDNIKSLSFEMVRGAFFDFYVVTWFPLTYISLAVDYALWGLNPVGYHLTNNILHALNAGLFFLFCLELFKNYRDRRRVSANTSTRFTSKHAFYTSILAALLFAIHPLRVESVAWAAERKDVLGLFFGISSMLAYLKHCRVGAAWQRDGRQNHFVSSVYYWVSLVLFCLSLLSKPLMVTLPIVLLMLDYFPLNRFGITSLTSIVFEKIPMSICAVAVSYITMLSQRPLVLSHAWTSMTSRVLNAFKSILEYLWLTVWPVNMSTFYLHPGNITQIGFEYVFPVVFFMVITVACFMAVKKWPVFLLVWLSYLITLLPALGLIQFGAFAMAPRFTYLPSFPISILLALGITALAVKYSQIRFCRFTVIATLVVILFFNCYQTIRQISFWKDDVTLWSRVIDLQPHTVGRAYFQRSFGYAAKGDLQKALSDMDEAITIALSKNYKEMHTLYVERARLQKRAGHYEEAIADYSRCLLSDGSAMRSIYYYERGMTYRELGQVDLAERDFKMAGTPMQYNKNIQSSSTD